MKDGTDAKQTDMNDQMIQVANNTLGFELLNLIDPDGDGNRFISPTSVFMVLSMVYNGADGETKQEIADTLQLGAIEREALNQVNARLMAMINDETNDVELTSANAIWLNNEFQFEARFAENNLNYFNAELKGIDVADDRSVEQINDWVKKATNDKIDQIVTAPLDLNLVAMLINAIYFKGAWTHPFNQQETEKHIFHLADGSTTEVPLMVLRERLMYMENETFQAVSLPYGDNQAMSMQLFLPRKATNLTEFQTELTNKTWTQWRAQFQKKQGTVMLPKFQLEYEVSLNEALAALGMPSAFDKNSANFEQMIEEDVPIWISEVKQKTFIDVNEAGTEAAGATSIEVRTTSAPADPPFELKVDRPFFMTITDEKTGVIVFMGTIVQPEG